MAQRLSMVILTYERHDLLRRQLLYFAGKPVHIVLADGSQQDWGLGSSGVAGAMSWEYFRIPGFNTRSSRLAEASARVATEYVCMLDDEECILWSGLQRAIGQLDKSPHVSCAGGLVARAETLAGDVHLVPWGRWSQPWSLLQDDPLSRFQEMASEQRTANLFYQVMRSSDLVVHARSMTDCAVFVPSAIEVGLAGFLALTGKWSMGDYPFWIRNGGSAVPPRQTTDRILEPDAVKLADALTRSLIADGRQLDDGMGSEQFIHGIRDAIDNAWGDSSATTDRSWSAAARTVVARQYQHSRIVAGRLGRARVPGLYRRRANQWGRAMSFAEFFRVFGDGNLEVLQDLLLIKSIWTEFPHGIPNEY